MRLDMSPRSLALIVAVVLFLLAAFDVSLGTIGVLPLGLAVFAAAFIIDRGGLLRG
jgi:hypothetical protein